MADFTEKYTQKTFMNMDEATFIVTNDATDSDVIVLTINEEDFWLPKDKASDVAEAIKSAGSN